MPLLGKELREQAARKRTYVVRAAYAVVLFVIFVTLLAGQTEGRDFLHVMGSGRRFFEALLMLQFASVAIFLPAMMSGVITCEKERESLALLFLTEMGPWEIVLQKYLGRLIPMLAFLLLGTPLLAVSYAYGGVETAELWKGVWALTLAALQVGAFSLMVSAWCRTTAAGFIGSYVFGAVLYLGPIFSIYLLEYLRLFHVGDISPVADPMANLFSFVFVYNPAVLLPMRNTGGVWTPLWVLVASLPSLAVTFVFLALSRRFLVSRAFLPPKHRLLAMFRRVDEFLTSLNGLVGGIILLKDRSQLPQEKPVAWREVTKKPLGRLNYLIRTVLVIEVPLILLYAAMLSGADVYGELYVMVYCGLWALTVLAVVARAASAVPGERTSQSLDVLLTTPLTGREIVSQKLSGVRRMILVFSVPFVTTFGVTGYMADTRFSVGGWFYFLSLTATVFVYLFLLMWFSMWVGLRARTRMRGILGALIGVIAWNAAPLLLLTGLREYRILDLGAKGFEWCGMSSPASAIVMAEAGPLWHGDTVGHVSVHTFMIANLLWHGFLLYMFRRLCLIHADRRLGRADDRRPAPVIPEAREVKVP